MQRWTSFTLRAAFIVGFLIVLPVIAMPSVAGLLDQLLYGNGESSVPLAREDAVPGPREKRTESDATRATHEAPFSPESTPFAERLESGIAGDHRAAPPPFRQAPDFLPRMERPGPNDPSADPAADISSLDEAAAQRIDAVRSRLEELGAEYVRLEMSEDGRTFHCQCDMLLDSETKETQPFEATRNDPVTAAEAVLAHVEEWRFSESSPPDSTKGGPAVRPR